MGERFEWGERWDEWTGSILEYLGTFNPPVIRDHDRSSNVLGLVRRGRVLTQAEAGAYGIEQEHTRALYLGIDWTPEGRALDDLGAAVYVSIGAAFDWADEGGNVWPCALKELSIVSVPYLKRGHIERPALAGITLADNGDGTMEETSTIVDAIRALAEEISALKASLATPAEEPAEMQEEIPTDETPEGDPEMAENPDQPKEEEVEVEIEASDRGASALRSRVAHLERELKLRDARAEVDGLSRTHVVSEDHLDRLVSLRLRDAEAYGIVVDSLPPRPAADERIAGVSTSGAATVGERALEIRAAEAAAGNSITYHEAAERAARQIRG
jgi:hypothetical protein